jgi:hypothetical protein
MLAILAVTGCASNGTDNLVYAKNMTFGANVSATGNAGPDITIGFRSQNLAIVPVNDDGTSIRGSVGATKPQDEDALSVLGQFESATGGSGVTLGEFFATGVAAQKLADGFACKVSGGAASLCYFEEEEGETADTP